jgi:hypothetical protein
MIKSSETVLAETVNFVSGCVDGKIKLKQDTNTNVAGRFETKQNFVSVLFQFNFIYRTGSRQILNLWCAIKIRLV